ncbi:hypothetical protein L873DRAFT_1823827 [Choiromyces venosus 120613-1]|uniref:Uncharacterized protein n=2 Tax=Choiromyces venosus 120613-1 TaxID=1336337 RepID=A0A3N4IVR1_9PEZI|nr:hypothetical protein L873DRAFT_1823827 [Choiromyces venosus 120613-1]
MVMPAPQQFFRKSKLSLLLKHGRSGNPIIQDNSASENLQYQSLAIAQPTTNKPGKKGNSTNQLGNALLKVFH